LRSTWRLLRSRAAAAETAISASLSPSSVCCPSHSENASRATPAMNAAASREDRRSLVWPLNCGSRSLADST